MPRTRKLELRFPLAGIKRRVGYRDSADQRGPHSTPWAINVRAEDPIARRLRGGSRPGLTKHMTTDLGTTVGALLPVDTVSATGAESMIAVIADATLKVIGDDGTVTTPAGELLTEAGATLTTEAGDAILIDTGDVPSTAFLVSRGQKVYAVTASAITVMDLVSGSIDTLEATSGTVPSDCTVGAVYRDRLFLAGGDNSVFCSRQGDFQDWDYGGDLEDTGAATVFQLSEATDLGGVVTALVPHRDAFLLAATADSLWVVRGDPVAGGTLRAVSYDVGIVGSRAWCRAGNDSVVFLANDGLYVVGANGEGLKSLSDDTIPDELRDIAVTTKIALVYHHSRRGVNIFLTPNSGSGTHWFYDFQTGSFWADQYQPDHEPAAVCRYGDDLLIAGADGYLRSVGGNADDGSDIQSHVLLGPVRLAVTSNTSRLAELGGALAKDSGTVTWRIVPGDSAEEAADNAKTAVEAYFSGSLTTAESYVKSSGRLIAGRNRRHHPQIRSPWYVIWLQSTDKWAFEWMVLHGIDAGRYR